MARTFKDVKKKKSAMAWRDILPPGYWSFARSQLTRDERRELDQYNLYNIQWGSFWKRRNRRRVRQRVKNALRRDAENMPLQRTDGVKKTRGY